MAEIVEAYSALSPSTSKADITAVFNRIINAPPLTFSQSSRVDLIRLILQDLKKVGSKAKLTHGDAALALLSIKTLGKDPAGSRYLSSSANLSTLLGLATTFKEKDELEATSEALRSIANALLLVEEARRTLVSKEVNGGDICISMLEKTISPDLIFILSRILFLATVSGPSYIETIVETKYHGKTIIDLLGSKLDLLAPAIQNGTPLAKEAMSDVLKFIFNILLHYPKMTASEAQSSTPGDSTKVLGDYWDPKLDPVLPYLLRAFRDLPPTSPCPIVPPLTHVIHSLIGIPISPSLRPVWLGQPVPSPSRASMSSSRSRTPQLTDSTPGSRSDSPTRTDKSPTTSKPSTIDRALSAIAAAGRSLSRSSTSTVVVELDVLQRAFDLLEQGFTQYFPGDADPDAPEIRQRYQGETAADKLDEVLTPVIVLITRLCLADEGCRHRVRQWIIPEDIDRTSPLDKRPDMLGKCLRLLGAVYYPQIKDAVGEMLYAACDSSSTMLSTLCGYGNVAGFLYNKGVMSAPGAPSGDGSGYTLPQDINPITGTREVPRAPSPEMTEEEREQEMDRLFVLFDRLERTGAIPPEQNPVRRAIQRHMGN